MPYFSSANRPHGARLRTLLAEFFGEMDLMTDLQLIESGRQHAVLVKIQFSSVCGQEESMIFHGKQAGDPSDRRRLMDFDFAAPAPRMIL